MHLESVSQAKILYSKVIIMFKLLREVFYIFIDLLNYVAYLDYFNLTSVYRYSSNSSFLPFE